MASLIEKMTKLEKKLKKSKKHSKKRAHDLLDSVLGACWGTDELGWNEGSRKKLREVIQQSNGFEN